ncbi:hypothetical protein A2331_01930 [Candidatus Falkowbacteria bacterium RIFOXYB2_FULL_34_18]|uniref:Methyltransferase type 11 domain-containing protein n=1 Tax=Candidatus Falkowbacteria bacterium RIFOXYD2_FULL_34_120 TaxID=1798007 RepID=A0A1F5TQB2_9BACT|nr:MAG: hypothetical protein A2331_01930 [Candidatus Falkowbacteria bacterium RIFOXYB2_FULL_34_18]OGF29444.1 MAG: hypothetical protein A2500_00995 [Candidatus Falkowbacteria bacterium RIFOXYC12_FULL_34_55]OGF36757.1 MAG: hypothetical protein A2466_03305 [Candidatus Falkowbacteria bacterium RIFOXYC2_FULL_34_220]OGF38970.1 MAG: hypothetical protein A2515_05420 [Candidatus Falkowbacteria bacterium RIFOXYD12_FULL_34_57]OGF41162.1 MAG: hypothetical protein A2531_01420 [Candidatus Falkowbacteria bact
MDKQTEKNLIRIVRKNYDDIADHYSETRKKHLWPELLKLTEKIKDGDRVLDVGCGSGRLLNAFRKKKIIYLGVDASKKLIHNAQGLNIGYNFVEGDILKLGEIPQIDFDYVFCIAVLQHIPGKKLQIDALKQLKNKISPRGKIVLTVWNMWSSKWQKQNFKKLILKFTLLKLIKKNKMDFGDILFDWKNKEGLEVSQRYYHVFRKQELKKICKKAGLKVKFFKKDGFNYYLVLEK